MTARSSRKRPPPVDVSPARCARYKTLPAPDRRALIVALYEGGTSQADISRAVGISEANVMRQLRRSGVLTVPEQDAAAAALAALPATVPRRMVPSADMRISVEQVVTALQHFPHPGRRHALVLACASLLPDDVRVPPAG